MSNTISIFNNQRDFKNYALSTINETNLKIKQLIICNKINNNKISLSNIHRKHIQNLNYTINLKLLLKIIDI